MNDDIADDIVSQLVDQINVQPSIALPEQPTIAPATKENMEEFLMNASSTLIRGSIDTIEKLRGLVVAAPDAKDIESLSALISSSAGAIETLNKIYIANKRNETSIKLKEMSIQSTKEVQEIENKAKITLNREELLKQLFDEAKIIDVTPAVQK